MLLDLEAEKKWSEITHEFQNKLLNNVWCSNCQSAEAMNLHKIVMEDDILTLKGYCKICHTEVVRCVE